MLQINSVRIRADTPSATDSRRNRTKCSCMCMCVHMSMLFLLSCLPKLPKTKAWQCADDMRIILLLAVDDQEYLHFTSSIFFPFTVSPEANSGILALGPFDPV